MIPPPRPDSLARKLEPQAEDDDDRRERHRLEATLKLMGIDRASPSIEEEATPFAPSSSTGTGKRRPESRGSDQSRRSGTPLSRLSSALGHQSPDPPADAMAPVAAVSPELAAAAWKDFDVREAAQAKALSEGKAKPGYTSPDLGSVRRAGLQRRESTRKAGEDASKQTSWSMSSSRPPSGEALSSAAAKAREAEDEN